MEHLNDLFNYRFYCENFFKIKTKIDGVQPFKLRSYQKRFINFVESIDGPARVIVLKPRQAGFSTLISSYLAHKMFTQEHFQGMAMCDKKERTQSIANMFRTFYEYLPQTLKPMSLINNTEQFLLDNPNVNNRKKNRGLDSGVVFETANDPNAGRSGTRRFAHLSEASFYRYSKEIDDGVQNSIPFVEGTYIFKESTANGKSGLGKSFYDLWNAAKRDESAYKPFFVAWHEVDDYQIRPPDHFKASKEEREILKKHPTVNEANLLWRRLKIREYQSDEDNAIFTPEERFKQDFPLDDVEAFLSTGTPIFDPHEVEFLTNRLTTTPIRDIKDQLSIKSMMLKNHWRELKIYSPPRAGKQYYIGADVAEGLAVGDSSSVCVMDSEFNEVANWHGKIDPDLFGHLLISLAILYNRALIVPEVNNMGHTTLTTIRNEGYSKLYREIVEDKLTKQKVEKLGWRTTEKSKAVMLNKCVAKFREGDLNLKSKATVIEMGMLSRGENGRVNLNGRDRVVALCLAIIGREDNHRISIKKPKPKPISGTGEDIKRHFDKQAKKQSSDFFY